MSLNLEIRRKVGEEGHWLDLVQKKKLSIFGNVNPKLRGGEGSGLNVLPLASGF